MTGWSTIQDRIAVVHSAGNKIQLQSTELAVHNKAEALVQVGVTHQEQTQPLGHAMTLQPEMIFPSATPCIQHIVDSAFQ